MYSIRTPNCSKRQLDRRWALPDRVFFACGACHILAYAFLNRFGNGDKQAVWIKPAAGHTGNHIYVSWDGLAFDYHGISDQTRFLDHYRKRALYYYPGWSCERVSLPADVLVSEAKSKTYDGLWLREPGQFHHNALPRAEHFLDRMFPIGLTR